MIVCLTVDRRWPDSGPGAIDHRAGEIIEIPGSVGIAWVRESWAIPLTAEEAKARLAPKNPEPQPQGRSLVSDLGSPARSRKKR